MLLTALREACRVHRPEVLGLTVTMSHNLPTSICEIEEVIKFKHAPRVMIGGRAVSHTVGQGLCAAVVEHRDQPLAVVQQLLVSRSARSTIARAAVAPLSAGSLTAPIPAGERRRVLRGRRRRGARVSAPRSRERTIG
ncbi:MAG: hypothetical protein ABSG43_11210 [Solirubrobacteraceae bacterium]